MPSFDFHKSQLLLRWHQTSYLNTHCWSHLVHHANKLHSFTLVSVDIQHQPVIQRNRSNNLFLDSLLAPVSLRAGNKWCASKDYLLQWKQTTFSLRGKNKMLTSNQFCITKLLTLLLLDKIEVYIECYQKFSKALFSSSLSDMGVSIFNLFSKKVKIIDITFSTLPQKLICFYQL